VNIIRSVLSEFLEWKCVGNEGQLEGVNSQNETVLSTKFWVDIIALGSIFKSFFECFTAEKIFGFGVS
jgi:hypothetical protein